AIGPTTWNGPASKSGLHGAREHIAAKNAETRETGIVGIRRMGRPAAGEAHFMGGQIALDQIGNANARNVGAICFNLRPHASEPDHIEQVREFGCFGVFAKQFVVLRGARAAVKILVRYGHETLVEERIALARDLAPTPDVLIFVVAQNANL